MVREERELVNEFDRRGWREESLSTSVYWQRSARERTMKICFNCWFVLDMSFCFLGLSLGLILSYWLEWVWLTLSALRFNNFTSIFIGDNLCARARAARREDSDHFLLDRRERYLLIELKGKTQLVTWRSYLFMSWLHLLAFIIDE